MIKISGLGISYGPKKVLDGLDLNLEGGNIYGLLGLNGAGKTTLLSLICGLRKPCSGKIEVDSYIPFERKPAFLGNIFFLPDSVEGIKRKAIDHAKERGRFWPGFSIEKYNAIMEDFDIESSALLSEMSAGQLKKAHLAFALACNTDYILLDEPTNTLDIPSKEQFRKILVKYTSDKSCIIISTHQVRDLERLMNQIIIIDEGKVVLKTECEGNIEQIFNDAIKGKNSQTK